MKKINRIVVLGGLGFIGSHLCRALVASGRNVRVIDRADTSRDRVADIESHLEICPCDIAQVEEIVDLISDAEILIHLVHSTVPQGSMDDPASDVTENVVTTAHLASQLSRTNLKKIVYISSGGAVYGENSVVGITENALTNPISSYGITKLANEKYLQMYSKRNDITCLIVRPANIYGPQQRLDQAQGLIGTLVDRVLRGQAIEIFGDGKVVRDYLYIDDLIRGILALVDYEGGESIFNLGTGVGHSILDVVDLMKKQLGVDFSMVHLPARGFDVSSNILNADRIKCETGWDISVDLPDGIKRVVNSFTEKG